MADKPIKVKYSYSETPEWVAIIENRSGSVERGGMRGGRGAPRGMSRGSPRGASRGRGGPPGGRGGRGGLDRNHEQMRGGIAFHILCALNIPARMLHNKWLKENYYRLTYFWRTN